MSDAGRGRIAIKFGAGPSSSSRTSRQTPSSTLGKRPRSHHALGGASDSESEDESHRGRHERITGFGAEGAETERGKREAKKEKEYVIERQANRNWKEAIKARGRQRRPPPEDDRSQQGGQTAETDSAHQEKSLKFGLTIKEKKPDLPEVADTKEQRGSERSKENNETSKDDDEPPVERTADEEAMDALLGKAPEKKQLTIAPHLTEDDAYHRDVETAGAPSTLQDYENMPVEEFGAALLRGMGWSGENLGPKVKEVRRRPNRLGLGAKELKEDEDLGGWNQNGKKKSRPRLDEYRREESKRKEGRNHEESYKRERERERRHERDGRDGRDGRRDGRDDRDRDYDRHRDRHRDYDRDRRR